MGSESHALTLSHALAKLNEITKLPWMNYGSFPSTGLDPPSLRQKTITCFPIKWILLPRKKSRQAIVTTIKQKLYNGRSLLITYHLMLYHTALKE
jgi:hypothetical protein